MPSSPNPQELEKISTKPLRDNPARYGYEKETTELTKTPTVTIGPNASYIVDPALAIGDNLPPKPEPPEPSEETPVLSSLEPNELPVWAQDTTVTFVGTGFSEVTEIIWNDSAEPTTFVDSEHVSTIVKPSTVEAPLPFTLQAWVVNGTLESEKKDFTFIT